MGWAIESHKFKELRERFENINKNPREDSSASDGTTSARNEIKTTNNVSELRKRFEMKNSDPVSLSDRNGNKRENAQDRENRSLDPSALSHEEESSSSLSIPTTSTSSNDWRKMSEDEWMLSQKSLNIVKDQAPEKVEYDTEPVDVKKLVKLQRLQTHQRDLDKLRRPIAREQGKFPVMHLPAMKFFEFLKIQELHDRRLTGKGIKVGVIDSWFDYEAKNLKSAITESTKQLAPRKATKEYEANKMRYNVGFSQEKGEYAITGHHGNHVASIVHEIAPSAEIKYINFQAEQGIGGKDVEHYCLAIDRAINSGVDFINFSLKFPSEGGGVDGPLAPKIREKLIEAAQGGIGLIIALGNDQQTEETNVYVNDLIELSESPEMNGRMILVAASQYEDGKERLASFSNHPELVNARKVIVAPGESIRAFGAGGYKVVKSGTSQASPMISGVSALVKEHLTKLELHKQYGRTHKYSKKDFIETKSMIMPENVFSLLLRSARDKTYTGSMILGREYGRGIVNPLGAIKMANQVYKAQTPLRKWAQKYKEIQSPKLPQRPSKSLIVEEAKPSNAPSYEPHDFLPHTKKSPRLSPDEKRKMLAAVGKSANPEREQITRQTNRENNPSYQSHPG